MKLAELISGSAGQIRAGDAGVEIAGLSYDSRRVQPGHLFFATAHDGAANRANIEDALSRGARAVVMRRWEGPIARPAVTWIESERPRLLMAAAASRFYHAPSERLELAGITGTSGKTTSAYLLASIFESAGAPSGIVGTIGIFVGDRMLEGGLTTPESIDFEAALSAMEAGGVRRVAAEISSIGLEEGRVEALNFQGCLFTNLGRDHLDYHGSNEKYFAAKRRLFTELLPRTKRPSPVAVVRGDDPYGAEILSAVSGRKVSFGMQPGFDVHPTAHTAGLGGIRAEISALGKKIEIESPLLGEINLINILGVSAMSVALGIETDAVVEGVRRCPGAPGRLEMVPGPPGTTVLVDYAHKPDALEAVLRNLRALEPARLICVFGCGGDRDRGKRPLMGAIAGRLADLAILTSDNPRTEDPLAIIGEVEAGLKQAGMPRTVIASGSKGGYFVQPDRRAAIELVLRSARPGDVIVIAGKGHEDYQIIGTNKRHFDDREVVREFMSGASQRKQETAN
ncbi:MAG: UDP-N-acetylmuramoyl-L-alanyl-D-glutamate--2,6-diaminopimelate ligase [Candidatus Binataceae bacterium]|nr:UDP-N-acetylmuramoyl-L-alanyl-D-glutamate--2,6-diaminopimelate ligase [Candidatus Binataceae bacterium]